MSMFVPAVVLTAGVVGISYFTGRNDTSPGDGSEPRSSRQVVRDKCSTPNQGQCLQRSSIAKNLYVADYPDHANALKALQRLEQVLKAIQQQLVVISQHISKLKTTDQQLVWANQNGMKVRDASDLAWQIKRIHVFLARLPHVTIGEVIKESQTKFTSYVIDKRDLSMCLRDKKTNILYADNVLTYVFLHELGHIMSPTLDHKAEFIRSFQMILRVAIYLKLYTEIDWSRSPVNYCDGVNLNATVWAH